MIAVQTRCPPARPTVRLLIDFRERYLLRALMCPTLLSCVSGARIAHLRDGKRAVEVLFTDTSSVLTFAFSRMPQSFSRRFYRKAAFTVAAGALVACSETELVGLTADRVVGRWQKLEESLPPVTLEVRRESGALVGQVWLSGVTYTLPATIDDSSIVLANPVSSAIAPFVGVIQKDGSMRATLRAQTDYTARLLKVQ